MKKLLTSLLVLVVAFVNAQWVSLNKSTISKEPVVKVLSDNDKSTIIDVSLSGFYQSRKMINDEDYQIIDLKTGVFTNQPGAPQVPVITAVIAVPDHAPVDIETIEVGEKTVFEHINLPPVRKSWWEKDKETDYIKSNAYYRTDSFYPETYAKVGSPQVFRDFRIVRVEIHPVRYNPVSKKMEVVTSVKLKLKYNGHAPVINPRTAPVRPIAPSFDKLYRSFITNYESFKRQTRGTMDTAEDLMLCIMPDELYDSFQAYADWKRRSGINVKTVKFSDFGGTAGNPVRVRNYIADAYHNWDTPPTYVLLVGDDGVFPKKEISYDYTFAYDDYFVEIDGNDYFPEMMIGRLTNKHDYRMRVMIKKFQMYEETPYMEDTSWFMKGICCSNNEHESQVTTKEYTRDLMLNDGGFTSVDAMMSDGDYDTRCTYSLSDVINALNEGRSYLNYRGEGWYDGWWANCTDFRINDVSRLHNGQKFTFFTSIGCGVAMFDFEYGNCFGEELIEKGTLSNPSGAIAFVGPTSNTHTTYNNKIDKGIYKGMFKEGLNTPGEALLRGKLYMYNVFGGSDTRVPYHYRIYHVLGDPSIHIWKKIPRKVTVTHDSEIAVGATSSQVHVTYQDNHTAVKNARVTFTGTNGFFAIGLTDSNGDATVNNLNSTGLTQYRVTVTGDDVYPYKGVVDISASGTEEYEAGSVRVYPNPFGSGQGVKIQITRNNNQPVSVVIYNINGQIVRKLRSDNKGDKLEIYWNGKTENGNSLDSGIYFAQIISGTFVKTVKLVLY